LKTHSPDLGKRLLLETGASGTSPELDGKSVIHLLVEIRCRSDLLSSSRDMIGGHQGLPLRLQLLLLPPPCCRCA